MSEQGPLPGDNSGMASVQHATTPIMEFLAQDDARREQLDKARLARKARAAEIMAPVMQELCALDTVDGEGFVDPQIVFAFYVKAFQPYKWLGLQCRSVSAWIRGAHIKRMSDPLVASLEESTEGVQ